jgi:hypothetical protein
VGLKKFKLRIQENRMITPGTPKFKAFSWSMLTKLLRSSIGFRLPNPKPAFKVAGFHSTEHIPPIALLIRGSKL